LAVGSSVAIVGLVVGIITLVKSKPSKLMAVAGIVGIFTINDPKFPGLVVSLNPVHIVKMLLYQAYEVLEPNAFLSDSELSQVSTGRE
jgi:cellobiose-specific phosphotransferase system component IIC